MPVPVAAAPAIGFDEVTKGYVPVEIEESALRSFEQDSPAFFEGLINEQRGVGYVGAEPLRERLHPLGKLLDLERSHVVEALQHDVFLREGSLELLAENLAVENVLGPGYEACCLVGICGNDSSPGVPIWSFPSRRSLAESIATCQGMIECVSRDPQPGRVTPRRLSSSISSTRSPGSMTSPLRRRDLPVAQDARGHVVELEGLAVADDRVPGVRAALVPADEVGVSREEIDDLPLAFVPPLGSDDDGCRHRFGAYSPRRATRRPYAAARSENFA